MEERVFWLWVRLPRWGPTGLERGGGWRGIVLLGTKNGSLSFIRIVFKAVHIKTWLDSRGVLHIALCSSQKAEHRCTQSALVYSILILLVDDYICTAHARIGLIFLVSMSELPLPVSICNIGAL